MTTLEKSEQSLVAFRNNISDDLVEYIGRAHFIGKPMPELVRECSDLLIKTLIAVAYLYQGVSED